MRPNPSFQGTAGKLRLPVPSALRALAASELKRYVSHAWGPNRLWKCLTG